MKECKENMMEDPGTSHPAKEADRLPVFGKQGQWVKYQKEQGPSKQAIAHPLQDGVWRELYTQLLKDVADMQHSHARQLEGMARAYEEKIEILHRESNQSLANGYEEAYQMIQAIKAEVDKEKTK